MTPTSHLKRNLMIAACLAFGSVPITHASQQLAIDMGCYNCHGANLRGESPSMASLAQHVARLKGDAAAEQAWVEKFRKGEFPHYIGAHQHLSPDSAKALVHWLVEGAK